MVNEINDLDYLINNPICVKCEYEWQKGYAASFFKSCDNPFRLDDEDFTYIHFRSFNNCTFYSDTKGLGDIERPVYTFDEIFQIFN